jgi:hypothetical protein
VDAVQSWWAAVTDVGPALTPRVALVAALVALVVVGARTPWSVAKHVVTLVHEASHAIVARLCGRRLSGIRLHADGSGLMLSSGRARGPGMVLTAAAGYLGPSMIGLGVAALTGAGRHRVVIAVAAVLLIWVLVHLRSWFGFVVVVLAGAAVVGAWQLPPMWLAGTSAALAWVLLAGAVRDVVALQRMRRRGLARDSDADALAGLTHLPGLVWVTFFLLAGLGALAWGTSLMVGG